MSYIGICPPPVVIVGGSIGLYCRVPIAGFLRWFIFSGPGVAEFTHFICPLLKPALDSTLPAAITAAVSSGRLVADTPNVGRLEMGVRNNAR